MVSKRQNKIENMDNSEKHNKTIIVIIITIINMNKLNVIRFKTNSKLSYTCILAISLILINLALLKTKHLCI